MIIVNQPSFISTTAALVTQSSTTIQQAGLFHPALKSLSLKLQLLLPIVQGLNCLL